MYMIIAIDLGTTSNRVIVFDKQANIVYKKQLEHKQIYPQAGWVEHDANQIWMDTKELLDGAVKQCPDVKAIGITNQRETIVAWDVTGPLHNAIVWQDSRTRAYCDELKKDKEFITYVHQNTGLPVDSYFSGTKIKWLNDNVIKDNQNVQFGTIDTWIIHKLCGEFVTDHTNASRTMLYNLNTNSWDETLLKKFGVTKTQLPRIVNSSEKIGEYRGIPICGIAGDQQASLFGQRCFTTGDIKNTYGTGCFCLVNTGEKRIISEKGLLTTVAISLDSKITYALEGSVFMGGAILLWLRDELGLIKSFSEVESICESETDSNSVYLIPAFVGLGTPYWRDDVRGALFGLTRGANKNHIVRAGVEAIAYQVKDLFDVMKSETPFELNHVRTDGGVTHNNFLMQFQSDITRSEIRVANIEETTALGAAFLAGLAIGFWSEAEITNLDLGQRVFTPKSDKSEAISGWENAVSQLLK